MAQQPDAFRDFGILPQGVKPPPEIVRCFFSRGRIIGQYIGTILASSLGIGLAALLVLTMPFPLNLLGCVAALAGSGAFVYLVTHNDYRWVELDGTTLRAKHLYTGRVIERSVEEIECLSTMVYQVRSIETFIAEGLLGRIRGVEVRFRDRRPPLRIMRADPAMTKARELIEALVFRMGQIREIDAEIVNFAGKPLVRHIRWKGELPSAHPGNTRKMSLLCCLLIALMFGPLLGFVGLGQHCLQLLGSVPPQEITLQDLITKGPGDNPHVALTDFQFGGYVVETDSRSHSWSSVCVALFPTDGSDQLLRERSEPQTEIKAILETSAIGNDAALSQFLQQKRVTGLCSDTPSQSFGTMGTKLTEATPGSRLSSAWWIRELREPPSAAMVRVIFLGSAACHVLVIAIAMVLFKMKS
jgi:hypothetical protein